MSKESPSPFGTGPYESLCTHCLTEAGAELVMLVIKGGKHGAGFEVQMTDPKNVALMPRILEDLARGIRDAEKAKRLAASKYDREAVPAPEIYAWVGEDEGGSGDVGLKQGVVPAGCVPLVATECAKVDTPRLRDQLQVQAMKYGKEISLVRYVPVQVVSLIKPETRQ
jgi:hypothetical protein